MTFVSDDLRRSARFAFDKSDDKNLKKTCHAILNANPQDVDARRLLGLAALRNGRPDLAETWFRETAARRPDSPSVWRDLARALVDLRRDAEAEAILSAAVARGVRTAGTLSLLGKVRARLDRNEDAQAAFEAAIELDPTRGEAYWGLADLGGVAVGDPIYAQAEELLADERFSTTGRIAVRYALAEANRLSGEHAAFLEHAKIANAEQRSQLSWGQRESTKDAWRAGERANAYVQRKSKVLEAAAQDSDAPVIPIFLIGELGSGARLAEAMLAHEPGVFAGGELNYVLGSVARVVESHTGRKFPEGVERLKPKAIAEARAAYFERAQRVTTDSRYIVDRSLGHAPLAGVLRVLFPEARLVRVERDPINQGLDIHRRHTMNKPTTALDLAGVGRTVRSARRHAAQADRQLTGHITTVNTDALAASPATGEVTLREAAGLPLLLSTFSSPHIRRAADTLAQFTPALLETCDRQLRPLRRALRELGRESGLDSGRS